MENGVSGLYVTHLKCLEIKSHNVLTQAVAQRWWHSWFVPFVVGAAELRGALADICVRE